MTLDQAIFAHVAAITPDVYRGRPPSPAPDKPYVVLDSLASTPLSYDSDHTATEEVRLRLHVWGGEDTVVRSLMNALEAGILFHEKEFNVANTKVLSISKGADELMLDPDRDAQGDELWHGVIDCLFLVARTPGS